MKATILYPGDRVKFLDSAFTQLPAPLNKKEAELYAGVVTVSDTFFVPIDGIEDHQSLDFIELPYSVSNVDVEKVSQ